MKTVTMVIIILLNCASNLSLGQDSNNSKWIIHQNSFGEINTDTDIDRILKVLKEEFTVTYKEDYIWVGDDIEMPIYYFEVKKDSDLMFQIHCNQLKKSLSFEIFSPAFKMANGLSVGSKMEELIRQFEIVKCWYSSVDPSLFVYVKELNGIFIFDAQKKEDCSDLKNMPLNLVVKKIIVL